MTIIFELDLDKVGVNQFVACLGQMPSMFYNYCPDTDVETHNTPAPDRLLYQNQ